MHIELTLLDEGDFALAAQWLATPSVNKWLYAEWRGRAIDERLVALAAGNPKNRLFMVRADGARAGVMAISDINPLDANAAVWFLMDPARQARGLASAGLQLLLDHAFGTLGLHSLSCSIIAGNAGSRRVLERNGFEESGLLREAFRVDGVFRDRIIFHRLAPAAAARSGAGAAQDAR